MLEYIRRIAVFIIVESIILGIVTNENYKKFIKMCSGMIMIILVLSPLDKIFGFTDCMQEIFTDITNKGQYEEIKEVIAAGTQESVKEQYEELLKKQIGTEAEKYGYIISMVEVTFDEKEENYIGDLSITMTDNNVRDVEKIIINGKKSDDNPAVVAVRNFITDNYGIGYEKVTVYVK